MDFSAILDRLDIGRAWEKDVTNNRDQGEDILYNNKLQSIDVLRIVDHSKRMFVAIHLKSDAIKTCKFLHPVLRFFLLVVISHRVGAKVKYYKNNV